MNDTMQARRDAFLMLTDEVTVTDPKRWLVVWGATSVDFGWNTWDTKEEAESDALAAIDEGFFEVKVHDLDAQ